MQHSARPLTALFLVRRSGSSLVAYRLPGDAVDGQIVAARPSALNESDVTARSAHDPQRRLVGLLAGGSERDEGDAAAVG